MRKAVLLSLHPKWCEKICNKIGENKDGSPIYEKRVEVRKSRPKLETPFKVYIYCTLQGSNKFFKENCNGDIAEWNRSKMAFKKGKVIGEFVCDKVDRIAHCGTCNKDVCLRIVDENLCYKELDYNYLNKCKLHYFEIDEYSNGGDVYGWHISNLVIYDKPKDLSEFERWCSHNCGKCKYFCDGGLEEPPTCEWNDFELVRPPQSWCYVEVLSK